MKKVIAACVIAIALCAFVVQTRKADQPAAVVGHYELQPARYLKHVTLDDGKVVNIDVETMMKIDTVTGETWTFEAASNAQDKTETRHWVPGEFKIQDGKMAPEEVR